MARPMGSVRLKKANPLTLLLGLVLCIFILFFLVSPSNKATSPSKLPSVTAEHHLSPPTSPYKKSTSKSGLQSGPPPVIRYNLNSVTVTANPIENKEHVLILTPMARFYQEYWDNLIRLSYPHHLITLGFILPKTKEGNVATAALQQQIQRTQKRGPEKDRFKSIIILRQDFGPAIESQDESERHKMSNQKARRAVMAKARNSLLFTTLGPATSWVLWLDSDVVESPPSLIQDLAQHNKDVIVPNCFQRYYNDEKKQMDQRPYDYNSWQDSDIATQMASKMGPDDILLEGYAEMATYRTLMAHLATEGGDEGLSIPLDGVGGTALLVKADVHRDGAMFPPFSFYHLIETEGFAKMAKRLGWQPYGLPNYKVLRHGMCSNYLTNDTNSNKVYHYNE
ncbi:mannan polymerase complexes MNN9 subunit [Metarhizium album ARSEF 1941]|uniref:Mannan polymerase complexes MNN9 subunit n=1 Tax=Metarhizium album (strain ARSEF 1941) TaxID=1081103 RepID=A0A0B2WS08_METAS|nr:mannan polymerase complexes MNN9 subunit [Metarhizium album ARSEF 1941]KHN96257.1 mannan polymerase complexes MNN9 subunit [Metarhizium album ARSEF 1941]